MSKNPKNIARIDQESKRPHGWYVRVRFQEKKQSPNFSLTKNVVATNQV
jgi:hypothetical protein